MEYKSIVKGRFIRRPNRFIAYVDLNGNTEKVHVKNTGRCRELLQPGAAVYLEKSGNAGRSTAYDLVAVEKGCRLINMDSQAPNRVVEERLRSGGLFPDPILVRPETVYGSSRFDFYVETGQEKIFIEVKGVTLEEDGIVRFPDAPSERAVKHVEELIRAKREGYRAVALFVVQMEGVKYFAPNGDTHPEFAEKLREAAKAGVEILAYDCIVTPERLSLNRAVPVSLSGEYPGLQAGSPPAQRPKEKPGQVFTAAHQVFFPNPPTDARENVRLASIPQMLLEWYDRNRRLLPWRELPTPYRVWVSEIMLQQTRVEAVKPYFERFMKALPDVGSLADVPEEQLLKLWEGLGYYNRARNLQKAARQIRERYDGEMPGEYEELLKLAGIGNYTAAAISSIAFGSPRAAVDGNVLRVVARVRKDERLISDPRVREAVQAELEEIMPSDRPGDFNQAMMELGACVCIPNGEPLCGECPLRMVCLAHGDGTERSYPRKEEKKPRRIEEKTVLIVQDKSRTAIRKRPARGLLAGMYEFPTLEGCRAAEDVSEYLAKSGIDCLSVRPLEDAKHIFTHKEWHMRGYMVKVNGHETGNFGEDAGDWIFVEAAETEEKYPIPSAYAAYTKYLRDVE